MRTTVTFDPDTEALVRKRMHERGVSFEVAINDAIREGPARPAVARRSSGPPRPGSACRR